MKKYIGTKRLEAKQMTRGDYNKYRGWTIPENENPDDEGYLIKDSDGYESWSPKKQFDDVYRVCSDMTTLPDTSILMCSNDYKERFKAEYMQLAIRYRGLLNMCEKWDRNELAFTPTCPRSTYDMQLRAMREYMAILEMRAVMESIKLDIKKVIMKKEKQSEKKFGWYLCKQNLNVELTDGAYGSFLEGKKYYLETVGNGYFVRDDFQQLIKMQKELFRENFIRVELEFKKGGGSPGREKISGFLSKWT